MLLGGKHFCYWGQTFLLLGVQTCLLLGATRMLLGAKVGGYWGGQTCLLFGANIFVTGGHSQTICNCDHFHKRDHESRSVEHGITFSWLSGLGLCLGRSPGLLSRADHRALAMLKNFMNLLFLFLALFVTAARGENSARILHRPGQGVHPKHGPAEDTATAGAPEGSTS